MENKKAYIKPVLESETFVPQCYCNNCGAHGTVYKFTCDAPGGRLYYFRNYPASGSKPREGSKGDWIGFYTPCGEYHEAEAQTGFYWGYVDYNGNGKLDFGGKWTGDETVIVWRGNNGRNGHATKNLDMDNWEIVKS